MKPIHLIPLAARAAARGVEGTATAPQLTEALNSEPGIELLEHLAAGLARVFRVPCRIRPQTVDLEFALDARRHQYYSTAILQHIERMSDPHARVLGVATTDLYVPVLTFVFGEAQLDGNCAVVSTARLREDFYGLPHREDLLLERLIKEGVHELGHTFGLRHCPDWRCVMTSSHAVERLDVKEIDFCGRCRKTVAADTYW